VLRENKWQKSVGFVEAPIALEEDSEDPNYPASPVHKPTRASTRGSVSKAAVAGKMSEARKDSAGASKARTFSASASKAAVAGKMSRARKGSGSGGRMTTRSGNAYY